MRITKFEDLKIWQLYLSKSDFDRLNSELIDLSNQIGKLISYLNKEKLTRNK